MKSALLLSALALAPVAAQAAPSADITETPAVLPRPATLEIKGAQGFDLSTPLKVHAPAGTFDSALLALKAGLPAGITPASSPQDALVITHDKSLGSEAYALSVTPEGITLAAGDAAGAFYGAQTLLQSVVRDTAGKPAVPSLKTKDAPRFKWRGLMVDPCRHFVTVPEMKRIIDLMAQHKLNTLHWHLTEDQGWRIEIRKYPKLTEVGSVRAESPVIGNRDQGDGKPYGPHFYTQAQIKEVVAYAKARHITVVPEIELPGHAAAAIAAYPGLGNDDLPGFKPRVRTRWGVEDYVFSPKESTFDFLKDVIDEVAELFPESPYIHIGGDECPKDQWNKSPFARKLMLEKGLVDAKGRPDAHRLQSWFIGRVEKMINAHGKKLIGWDEIQEGGLSPTATMMVWRSWDWATHAVKQGNEVVMTPTSHCYFDYGQGAHPKAPFYEAIGGHLPLEKVYSMEPVPGGLTPEQERKVIGVQGNLWSEYLFDQAKWEYMAFPRAIALAEVAWSPKSGKDFAEFSARLARHEPRLDAQKVNYRKADGTPANPQK